MCLIIDANRVADFCDREKPYMQLLWTWISRGGKIVSGGHLETELFRHGSMRDLVTQLSRSGQLKRYSRAEIEPIQAHVSPGCRSDDPHVVALAIRSGADLVVTEDTALISDLKNAQLVGTRRKIYKEDNYNPRNIRNHGKLLRALDCP
ncbi:MAG: hypothetical protein ACKOPE_11315 [Novosphingobium sp.]